MVAMPKTSHDCLSFEDCKRHGIVVFPSNQQIREVQMTGSQSERSILAHTKMTRGRELRFPQVRAIKVSDTVSVCAIRAGILPSVLPPFASCLPWVFQGF